MYETFTISETKDTTREKILLVHMLARESFSQFL